MEKIQSYFYENMSAFPYKPLKIDWWFIWSLNSQSGDLKQSWSAEFSLIFHLKRNVCNSVYTVSWNIWHILQSYKINE